MAGHIVRRIVQSWGPPPGEHMAHGREFFGRMSWGLEKLFHFG